MRSKREGGEREKQECVSASGTRIEYRRRQKRSREGEISRGGPKQSRSQREPAPEPLRDEDRREELKEDQ